MLLKRKERKNEFEFYEQDELECIDEHIKTHFGDFANVFHELISPDIHLDIALIDPTPERNYYTLVTMGAGAHIMNLPQDAPQDELGRAEYLICLPPDWNIEDDDETWYWPIRWLKIMGRLPIEQNTWLGYGHTVPSGGPVAENTNFRCMMLANPGNFDADAGECILPNGDWVNFYKIIPIYENEMEFKLENDADELIELLYEAEYLETVDIFRPSVCEGGPLSRPYESFVDRTARFWNWFLENEKELSNMAADRTGTDSETMASFISEGVSILSDNLSFNIGGKNEFTFTVEGREHLFYVLPYVISKMPRELEGKWNFFPFSPGTGGRSFAIGMNDMKVEAKDVFVSLDESEPGLFDLKFYSETFDDVDEGERVKVFSILMNVISGENLTFMMIDGIEPVDSKDEGMFPLTELEKELRSRSEGAELPSDVFKPYKLEPYEPDPEDEMLNEPRSDIIDGVTNYLSLVTDFLEMEHHSFISLDEMGATAAYLILQTDTDTEDCLEDCRFVISILERKLLNPDSDEQCGILLGFAAGEECGYIDLLTYDLDRFFESSKDALKDFPRTVLISKFNHWSSQILLSSGNDDEISNEIDLMHSHNYHQNIVELIEGMPREKWNYDLKGKYARALNNVSREEEALEILMSTEEEGNNNGVWHYRVGYALFFLDREEEALEHFEKSRDLGEDDTEYFIDECKRILSGEYDEEFDDDSEEEE